MANLITKFNHPDIVGGIVWADCELAWINDRIEKEVLAEREACISACESVHIETMKDASDAYLEGRAVAIQKCIQSIKKRKLA